MAKKITIEPSSRPDDFALFAISTNQNEIQFCSLINRLFFADLQLQSPTEIAVGKKILQPHAFSYFDEMRNLKISVVDNLTEKGVLVDFMKNISFFVKFSPIVNQAQVSEYQQILSLSNEILFVQKIDSSVLKTQQANALQTIFHFV